MTEQQLEVLKASIQALINDQAYLYALLMKRTHQDEGMIPFTQELFEKLQSEWKKETAHNIEVLLGLQEGEQGSPDIRILLGEEDGTPYDFS